MSKTVSAAGAGEILLQAEKVLIMAHVRPDGMPSDRLSV